LYIAIKQQYSAVSESLWLACLYASIMQPNQYLIVALKLWKVYIDVKHYCVIMTVLYVQGSLVDPDTINQYALHSGCFIY
jgi:hypothetical protein